MYREAGHPVAEVISPRDGERGRGGDLEFMVDEFLAFAAARFEMNGCLTGGDRVAVEIRRGVGSFQDHGRTLNVETSDAEPRHGRSRRGSGFQKAD